MHSAVFTLPGGMCCIECEEKTSGNLVDARYFGCYCLWRESNEESRKEVMKEAGKDGGKKIKAGHMKDRGREEGGGEQDDG